MRWLTILSFIAFLLPFRVFAQESLLESSQAVVLVACGGRQGSGSVVNAVDQYVLTNGHVPIDTLTGTVTTNCQVAFPDALGRPTFYYRATVVRSVFNQSLNRDFAILKIGSPLGPSSIGSFPFVKTNEFSNIGDRLNVYGYSGADDTRQVRTGIIQSYIGGFIQTDAEIRPGDSGGAALNNQGHLVGVPTRIVTLTREGSPEKTTYELIDIRAVMNWLDTYGPNEHDKYFTHADSTRYHQSAVFINQTSLGCVDLARSPDISSVYCLMPDGTRLAFPNDKTFYSWFPDFTSVKFITASSLSDFRLSRNTTFRPGSLVKVQTAPQVYVVVDSFGTLRWIPTEQKAIELWGPAWAGQVYDVPDEFWVNYTVGQPLD